MFQTDNGTEFEVDGTGATDKNGRNSWVVAVKATFDLLPQGRVEPAETQLPLLQVPEYHGEDGGSSIKYEADLLPAKPGVDVVINGDAHAPGGGTTTKTVVGLRIGGPPQRTHRAW